MSRYSGRPSFVLAALSLLALTGCGSGTGDPEGSGGSGGQGVGGQGTGGSSGSGGTGVGGTGTGGTSGGGPVEGWTFDSGLEGWDVVFTEGGATVMGEASFVADGGDGSGAVQLDATFDGPEQGVLVGINLTSPLDLTGKILTAKFQLISGLSENEALNPGGIKFYVKTGTAYAWAENGWTNITTVDGWTTVTLDMDNPQGFQDASTGPHTPSEVGEIGISLNTGGGADVTWLPAVLMIDSVTY